MRLDRFLANLPHCSHRQARLLLASGRASVNGEAVCDGTHDVRIFDRIELDGRGCILFVPVDNYQSTAASQFGR